jgi:thiamine-monophosphate kinase
MRGFLRLAGRFNITLAGGDTAESPAGILADIVVLGSAPKGTAIRRSGARPGDFIYVTGTLGGSAATLQRLRSGEKLRPADFPAHYHPLPRLEVGRYLRERRLASAMIDISDGLSTDLFHICQESGVGAEINREMIPLASIGRQPRQVDLKFALHGGEDYELLFTAPARATIPARVAGVPITKIGCITRTKRLYLVQNDKKTVLRPEGWQHFAAER